MHSDKLVVFPQDLLETMTIESTLFLPNNEDLGVAILSKQINDHYIAKVYQLSLSEDQQQYNFIQELAVFKYETQDEIDQLITRLPEMSGLEMLIMLNPVPPFPSRSEERRVVKVCRSQQCTCI